MRPAGCDLPSHSVTACLCMSPWTSRRTFLKTFLTVSAASLVNGQGWNGLLLADTAPGIGIMKLRVSDYPALAVDGGSVRLTAGPLPPVVINRQNATTYYAMSVVCQHLGCFVPIYNPTLGCIQCACHGSRYAIDGALLGGPATRGLEAFETAFDGVSALDVRVPGLAFDVGTVSVQPASGASIRLALTFPAAAFNEYQVYHSGEANSDFVTVLFATSQTGVANKIKIKPTANDDITVYVDATGARGFYKIALLISEYQG